MHKYGQLNSSEWCSTFSLTLQYLKWWRSCAYTFREHHLTRTALSLATINVHRYFVVLCDCISSFLLRGDVVICLLLKFWDQGWCGYNTKSGFVFLIQLPQSNYCIALVLPILSSSELFNLSIVGDVPIYPYSLPNKTIIQFWQEVLLTPDSNVVRAKGFSYQTRQ